MDGFNGKRRAVTVVIGIFGKCLYLAMDEQWMILKLARSRKGYTHGTQWIYDNNCNLRTRGPRRRCIGMVSGEYYLPDSMIDCNHMGERTDLSRDGPHEWIHEFFSTLLKRSMSWHSTYLETLVLIKNNEMSVTSETKSRNL